VSASPLSFFRNGPPPPKLALLSDALFFTHVVAISDDAAAATSQPARSGFLGRVKAEPAGVGAQVELALEALSPCLLNQLYYGYYWVPGSRKALVFAAYRRRFTAEQTAAWQGAEIVTPAFAALLGAGAAPDATWVLSAAEGMTAIRWDDGPVPGQVLFRPVAPEAGDEERGGVRAALLRAIGAGNSVLDLEGPPAARPSRTSGEIVVGCGSIESRLSAEHAATLDVRDKGALAGLRRARLRDAILWKVAAGSFVLFFLLALGEVLLMGGGLWQKALSIKMNAQAPEVARITTAQNLAHRIDELSTERLLPLEMVSIISAKKPESVQFIRAFTNERNALTVDAEATNPGDISIYRTQLATVPECANVEVRNQRTRNNVASFTLVVTFKPGTVKPAVRPS
jgi:hypothetical protein